MNDIIYFELNNWSCGKDYPNTEPFISWMKNDLMIKFRNREWVNENKLCVVISTVDMSQNFCITATRKWVENNCPLLLEEYREFLRTADEDGYIEGRFGSPFLEYSINNIGIKFYEEDD